MPPFVVQVSGSPFAQASLRLNHVVGAFLFRPLSPHRFRRFIDPLSVTSVVSPEPHLYQVWSLLLHR